jgi:hypothetical protein
LLFISEAGGVDAAKQDRAKQARSLTAAVRRMPWSLLRAKWLDVPIAADVGQACPTWATFAEGFERCLRDVSLHVGQRVTDREGLEGVVTEVVVENLHLLASQLGQREKLDRLLVAADLLIARRAAGRPAYSGQQLECEYGRQERHDSHPADLRQEAKTCSPEGE